MSDECKCGLRDRLVGDGCSVCNPEIARSLAPVPGSQGERQSDELNVICPYCLYAYQAEAADYDEHERTERCSKCERDFLLHDEMSVTHYTRPLPANTQGQQPEGSPR